MRSGDERVLTALLEALLREQMERVLVVADWQSEDQIMFYALHPVMLGIARDEAQRKMARLQAMRQLSDMWDKVWGVVSGQVWALVRDINITSATQLSGALQEFFAGGQTMGELRDKVATIFTPERAQIIARTEVTRAYSAAGRAASDILRAEGFVILEIWNTDNDDLVCDECGPRNGTAKGDGWDDYPPLHPNCRCSIEEAFA